MTTLQSEVGQMRAELNVLKWHAALLKDAIEMRKELEEIRVGIEKLKQEEKKAVPAPVATPSVKTVPKASPAAPVPDAEAETIEKTITAVAQNDATVTAVKLTNSGEKMTQDRLARLAEALLKNTHVITLELAHCAIGNEQAKRIAAVLAANKTLRSLNLETNSIGADGIKALAVVIAANTTLVELRLANQQQPIGPAAEKDLAAAVDANKTLTVCSIGARDSLARNKIDDALMRNKEILRKARSPTPAAPAVTKMPTAASTTTAAAAPSPPDTPLAPSSPGVSPSPAVAREAQQLPRQPTPYPDTKPRVTATAAPTTTTTATKPAPTHAAPTAPAAAKPAAAKAGTTTLGRATAAPTAPAVPTPATKTATPPASAATTATAPQASKTLPYAELIKKPKDVDPSKMETYLSDEEFKTVLKMTRADFYKMPVWKQQQAKRAAKLF